MHWNIALAGDGFLFVAFADEAARGADQRNQQQQADDGADDDGDERELGGSDGRCQRRHSVDHSRHSERR